MLNVHHSIFQLFPLLVVKGNLRSNTGLVMEKDMGELLASSVSARSDSGCENWNGLAGGVLD